MTGFLLGLVGGFVTGAVVMFLWLADAIVKGEFDPSTDEEIDELVRREAEKVRAQRG